MNLLLRAAAVAALLLPLAIGPAQAQDYRSAFGLYGGGFGSSALNRGGEPAHIYLKPTWIVGAQAETWLGTGRFGIRGNFGYAVPPFRHGDSGPYGDVNTYLADLNLLARLVTPARDRVWAPFLNLGLGVVHYNPGGDHTGLEMPQGGAVWENDPETMFAGVIGIGTDIITSPRIGFRLELADHIAFRSPLHRVDRGLDRTDPWTGRQPLMVYLHLPAHGRSLNTARTAAIQVRRSATCGRKLRTRCPRLTRAEPANFAKSVMIRLEAIDVLGSVVQGSCRDALGASGMDG
jgi:hypothetical protein